jgi:hypothetical protein
MKSLVEEASSVSKAIEKAWIRAGKPTSFSVKIYEEAQSGFLGFNSKPAKIGLFFEEHAPVKNYNESRKRPHTAQSEEQKGQEKRPHSAGPREGTREGSRDRNNHDGQRPQSDRRRPQSSSFEKKEFDRPERTSRPERSERQDRPERQSRPERSDRRRPSNQSFERRDRDQTTTTQTTFISDAQSPKQAEVAPQTQPQQSTRRVLKVSNRRYVAPKNESSSSTPATPSFDNDSTKE